MPNQYTGSFEHIIYERYGCSAKELLKNYAEEGVTYIDAGKRLGFQHVTIRKWAKRFGLKLKVATQTKPKRSDRFLNKFKESTLNQCNVLSRKWLPVI
jgi:hypothetical protein